MSAMGCREFIGQLDSWMEGERHPAARAHVQDCESCRSFASDLDAIQVAAPTLSVADPEPAPRVWTALRAQLVEEGLIHDPVHKAGVPGSRSSSEGCRDRFSPEPISLCCSAYRSV